MSIATIKLNLAKKIIDTDDVSIINHIKAIFDTRNDNWFEELSDEVKASVKQGVSEADKGIGKPHLVVMKDLKKWLKK
ncbi:MAG: hypothetical protein ACHQK8_03550 [Bacteroidia bacterium]